MIKTNENFMTKIYLHITKNYCKLAPDNKHIQIVK